MDENKKAEKKSIEAAREKKIVKVNKFNIPLPLIDILLIMAFFYLANAINLELDNKKKLDVQFFSLSQSSGHVKFIASNEFFIGFKDNDHPIQVAKTYKTLKDVKVCIEEEFNLIKTKFTEFEEISLPNGISIAKDTLTNSQSLDIDLAQFDEFLLIGIETCCQAPLPSALSGHPIQAHYISTLASSPITPIELRNDATNNYNAQVCARDVDQETIVKEVLPLPSQMELHDICDVAVLELK